MALSTITTDTLGGDDPFQSQEVTVYDNPPPSYANMASQLPREIIKRIVIFAMTAEQATFVMPCLTNSFFRPQVNLACLLLDRDLYHTARQALYAQNAFIFRHYGSDIKTLVSSVGLYACRKQSCMQGGGALVFNEVVFQLGDTCNPERANMQVYTFGDVLFYLRRPLHINNLTINIAPYTWRSNQQLKAFCTALRNVIVKDSLTIRGLDVHLELELRQLAMALRMEAQPVRSDVSFRTAGCQQLGRFSCTYVRAQTIDDLEVHNGRTIEDPLSKYCEWVQTAKQDCYVNGLDYVTDFGYFSY
ncbi:MAG: hypothetical protein Q9217_001622 [Psora testacea]